MISFRTGADNPCLIHPVRFSIHITKIHVNHIHKNTIMTDEHTVSSQSSMQYISTRLPIIILQRVEEQLPPVRVVMGGAVCR